MSIQQIYTLILVLSALSSVAYFCARSFLNPKRFFSARAGQQLADSDSFDEPKNSEVGSLCGEPQNSEVGSLCGVTQNSEVGSLCDEPQNSEVGSLCGGGKKSRVGFLCDGAKNSLFGLGVVGICLLGAVLASSLFAYILYNNDTFNSFGIRHEYFASLVFFYLFLASALSLLPKNDSSSDKTRARIVINSELVCESLVIFSFFSRFGCLVAGCCEGKAFGIELYPTAIVEIIFAACVFALLLFLKQKRKAAKELARLDSLSVYVFLYSIFRFIIEFFRANTGIRLIMGINFRQLLAVVIIFYIIAEWYFKLKELADEN